MITETTAISCAAFGALSTGLGIGAGIGWMREAKRSLKWRNRAWRAIDGWAEACRINQGLVDKLVDTEDQLRRIERQRSDNTRRGNLTKTAKRKALVDATTAAVARANADRAEPRMMAA